MTLRLLKLWGWRGVEGSSVQADEREGGDEGDDDKGKIRIVGKAISLSQVKTQRPKD